MSDKLITAKDVGRLAKLHQVTILRLAREGKIPHVRLNGTNVRFRHSEVKEWLEGKK